MSDFQETLYEGYGQRFQIDKLLHEVRTERQHLVIFENARMGRVMALDGVVRPPKPTSSSTTKCLPMCRSWPMAWHAGC